MFSAKILDILRDKMNHDLPKETRVLYVVPLVNIYQSLSKEMDKLNIPFQVMSMGSSTVVNQSVKVLFISPERLQNKSVLKSILQLSWSCISIDEPHLALEWGLSKSKHLKPFREAFSKLNALNNLGTVFEMHSATIPNIEMLCQLVGRKNSSWTRQLLVPERSNLTYFLFEGKSAPESILHLPIILKCLEENEEGITLVYVQSIKEGSNIFMSILNYCEENNLIKYPTNEAEPILPVSFLHSSLTEEKKIEIIEKAISCKIRILIATSAAGAGINLPVVRFVGWGLDREPSGIIQSQGRTARNPFTGEGVVIWAHSSKNHGHRLPKSSQVRELLKTDCLRKTINTWFSHGTPVDENQNPPEFCCNFCMAACVEKSDCETCKTKLDKFKPTVLPVDTCEVEKMLTEFLKSLAINEVTPSNTPSYSEESLATEIIKNVKECQDLEQSKDFLAIFSLGDKVTEQIVNFLKDSKVHCLVSEMCDSSSTSSSDSGDSSSTGSLDTGNEYFDGESE